MLFLKASEPALIDVINDGSTINYCKNFYPKTAAMQNKREKCHLLFHTRCKYIAFANGGDRGFLHCPSKDR